MKRRDLLKAAPLAFIGCAPVLSQAHESTEDRIQHHVDEIMRLLRETKPADTILTSVMITPKELTGGDQLAVTCGFKEDNGYFWVFRSSNPKWVPHKSSFSA